MPKKSNNSHQIPLLTSAIVYFEALAIGGLKLRAEPLQKPTHISLFGWLLLACLGLFVVFLLPEDKVAFGVALPGLDERKVPSDGLLHNVVLPVELPDLARLREDLWCAGLVRTILDGEAASLDDSAKSCRGEERGHTSTPCPNPLCECALHKV